MKLKNTCSWKKNYDKTGQQTEKQKHYFVAKFWIVKVMAFPVVMYGCESWTIKNAESWRIDAFELWCWKRLLRVPSQSILKEINSEYSLEGVRLKLKLQIGYLMQITDSLEKTLMLGKIEGRRRKGQQRMRWLDGIINSMDMSLSKLWDSEGHGSLTCCSLCGHKYLDRNEWLNNTAQQMLGFSSFSRWTGWRPR